jgi:hypothetical protein
MSPKTKMKLLQVASSLAFSLILGSTWKLGKQVDEKIKDHFTDESDKPTDEQND